MANSAPKVNPCEKAAMKVAPNQPPIIKSMTPAPAQEQFHVTLGLMF
jgi:hypothetical protein